MAQPYGWTAVWFALWFNHFGNVRLLTASRFAIQIRRKSIDTQPFIIEERLPIAAEFNSLIPFVTS
jgi:hypothetical protein